MNDVLLIHGGVGWAEPPRIDMNAIISSVDLGQGSVNAAVKAVSFLEDDPRFNAGTGSFPRIDGSVQMDAAVMAAGNFGAVIGIEKVRNPVLVALAVMNSSPHNVLSGDGAIRFARIMGFEEYDPMTPENRNRLEKLLEDIKAGNPGNNPRIASFSRKIDPEKLIGTDTVGAIARINGRFSAAVSTGGVFPMMRGRVGDVPFIGCGFYAGDKGAAVATGIGEEIMKRLLCYNIYSRMGKEDLQDIVRDEIEKFGVNLAGVIAITKDQEATFANGNMAVGRKASHV